MKNHRAYSLKFNII